VRPLIASPRPKPVVTEPVLQAAAWARQRTWATVKSVAVLVLLLAVAGYFFAISRHQAIVPAIIAGVAVVASFMIYRNHRKTWDSVDARVLFVSRGTRAKQAMASSPLR